MFGEVFRQEKSAGGYFELWIMPTISDPYDVLTVLTSLLMITLAGDAKAPYKLIATKIGMNGDKKKPAAEGKMMRRLNAIAAELGPFPHDVVDVRATAVGLGPKQDTRQLLAACPECGVKIRLTALAINTAGLPVCGKDGVSFELRVADQHSGKNAATDGDAAPALTDTSDPSPQRKSPSNDYGGVPSSVIGDPSADEESDVPTGSISVVPFTPSGADQRSANDAVATRDPVSALPDSASEATSQQGDQASDADDTIMSDAGSDANDRPQSDTVEAAFTSATPDLNESESASAQALTAASTDSSSDLSSTPGDDLFGNGEGSEASIADACPAKKIRSPSPEAVRPRDKQSPMWTAPFPEPPNDATASQLDRSAESVNFYRTEWRGVKNKLMVQRLVLANGGTFKVSEADDAQAP